MPFVEQLTRLRAFLDADELHEQALDYMAAQGYLTALCICPEEIAEREWLDTLFAEPPHYSNEEERKAIEDALIQLKIHIGRLLAADDDLQLPCTLEFGDNADHSDIRSWCIGFMEGVFLRESLWFERAEEEVSELLLPIMLGSGLFDEQEEFAEMAQNPDLSADMLQQIPETLTALFLLLNAPEEKPALLKPRSQ